MSSNETIQTSYLAEEQAHTQFEPTERSKSPKATIAGGARFHLPHKKMLAASLGFVIPIRIDFDRPEGHSFNAEGMLRPGLSAESEVRVRWLPRKRLPTGLGLLVAGHGALFGRFADASGGWSAPFPVF